MYGTLAKRLLATDDEDRIVRCTAGGMLRCTPLLGSDLRGAKNGGSALNRPGRSREAASGNCEHPDAASSSRNQIRAFRPSFALFPIPDVSNGLSQQFLPRAKNRHDVLRCSDFDVVGSADRATATADRAYAQALRQWRTRTDAYFFSVRM